MKTISLFTFILLIFFCSCAGGEREITAEGISISKIKDQPQLIKLWANPERGYRYPAYLWIPEGYREEDIHRLLVTPNNTGTTSDNFRVHEKKVRETLSGGNWEYYMGVDLNVPHLMPVFPRPGKDWHLYTHSLDRDSMEIKSGDLERLDLQLIRMIEDARTYLEKEENIELKEQILLSGFSASGTFANRFTLLHPQRVRAVAVGGVNAIPILPIAEYEGKSLPYHIGIADLDRYIQGGFDLESWRMVAQYVYMGTEDDNDTTDYDDGFTRVEAQLVWDTMGKDMSQRWSNCVKIYRETSPAVQMVTYKGLGHAAVLEDMVSFLRANALEGFHSIEPTALK